MRTPLPPSWPRALDEISSSMKNHQSKLSQSKTKMMLMGRWKHFEEFAATVQSSLAEGSYPQLVNLVHSLSAPGFLADAKLSHSSICEDHYLQLAERLCPMLEKDDLAFVTSWLYYNNVAYLIMKPSAIRKLQQLQNATACLLSNSGYHKHIKTVLHSTLNSQRTLSQVQGICPYL